jgi:hypothetical protein
MDLMILLIASTVFFSIILILLVVMWTAIPNRGERGYGESEFNKEISNIKHQIEHEAGNEAEEELMPYKPPRLDKPDKKRI